MRERGASKPKTKETINMAVKNWRDVVRTAADYKKFFRGFDDFTPLFGEELTLKYLMEVPFSSLVDVAHFQNTNEWMDTHGEYLGSEAWVFEEWKGEWKRDVRKIGFAYLMPGNYQGLHHAQLVRCVLSELFPWITEFNLDVYSIESSEHAEIYVNLETHVFGRCSLYVPIRALIARDVEAIKQRNIKYFGEYYGRRAQEDERFATYVDTVLNDPVTQRFLACVADDDLPEITAEDLRDYQGR
jgi:hypothetical protein